MPDDENKSKRLDEIFEIMDRTSEARKIKDKKRRKEELKKINEDFKRIKERREEEKKASFQGLKCVRCSSQEDMTYYTRTREMLSKSQFDSVSVAPRGLKYKNTIQKLKFDFPVCSACKRKARSFTKLKVKYLGRTAQGGGKNYKAIPMVKPADTKKWIRYDIWIKS